jgi:hypothetical protein
VIVIYTHNITPRVSYTMNLVFERVLNVPFELTDDLQFYQSSSLPKLAYTNSREEIEFFIEPEGLLFEDDIRQEIQQASGAYLGFPLFFKRGSGSFLPYDLFATVFYFASRYEEYLPSELDTHQRFQAENSLAFKHGFLNKPFLNYLIDDLSQKLKHRYPALEFKKRDFNFLSTIDIDNAFAFANKGFKRNVGGLLKDLVSLKLNNVMKRLASNINSSQDPYNTFDAIHIISNETKTALQYFVLIGDHSAYDKNPHHTNKGFRALLRKLSSGYTLGLHPSYQSFNQPERIEREKHRLENSVEKKVTAARCHFLRLQFPETYRAFIRAGITDDYTMIYASQPGFRTGLCVPYHWFDLENNSATYLTLHSSVVMEGTLRDYNKLSPKAAGGLIDELMQEVKKFGGEFVSVWHNDSFVPGQTEWVEVYKTMLRKSTIH